MAELKKLGKKRSLIKDRMARINNSVDDTMSASEAKVKATKIEELWHNFEKIQAGIEELTLAAVTDEEEEVDFGPQETERQIFENIYFETATRVQTIIDQEQEDMQMQMQMQRQAQNVIQPAVRQNIEQPLDIKLPTLRLPEFKGDCEEWLLFKDAYISTIHENARISSIQKFQYLKNSLKGEALQIVSNLATSAENYENAWELLKDHYDNSNLLIHTHLTSLFNFPVVIKDKPDTIKQLIVHIRTHCKALKTLQLPVEHWDEVIIHMTKSTLGYVTQKEWESECKRDRERRKTLEEYLTFLNEYCNTLGMIERRKTQTDTGQQSNVRKPGRLIAMTSVSPQKCPKCQGNHM